jgi:hypothetical protein
MPNTFVEVLAVNGAIKLIHWSVRSVATVVDVYQRWRDDDWDV